MAQLENKISGDNMKIYNIKIYTMNSEHRIIENGYIEIDGEKIKAVRAGKPQNICENDVDGKSMCCYPGFIDDHTHLGLSASGVGIEGEDFNEESDPCTPQLRICDGINPIDYSFEQAVKAGVTTVLVSPGSSNPVAGEISAIKTYGKCVDKMLMQTVGMKFSMGENPKATYSDKENAPYTRMAVASIIREALKKAERYGEDIIRAKENDDDLPELDMKSEALLPVLDRKIKAHFHCHRADDIFTALRISKEFELDSVLIHCTDGHLIADELAEEKACCVIGPIICDRCKPEMANLTPENAGILASVGCEVAICTDHSEVPIEYLPISAGICVKNGMPFEKALEGITCTAAKIAGISDRVGSIEAGKDADFCLFNGNPFEIMSSPLLVFCGGKAVIKNI